jgi:glucose-6-phosphate 1-dehydrogenase
MTTAVKSSPQPAGAPPRAESCVMVLFGAGGDLTKRLLMPALYNLACDGLLPQNFALIAADLKESSTAEFRAKMSADIPQFSTRKTFDEAAWQGLVSRFHFVCTAGENGYANLAKEVSRIDGEVGAGGNVLFYLAVPPSAFGPISANLDKAGFRNRPRGWTRVIVEKPFGHDLPTARQLSKDLLQHWDESQIFRVDHYLGKETVQNLLLFRFANGIFEPLWNKTHIDHIQFTVDETVGVEGRGAYYESAGVLRDMIQNHMFQMLAYLCMEPPGSFAPDAIRNEKAKLLEAVRVMSREEVAQNCVRGQYGPGKTPDGKEVVGYRQEPGVNPESSTETFAALRLFIDNWRWEGVPIYLRSGKRMWKRGTEIIVQFKKAPAVIFRHTPAEGRVQANTLIFHIQPDQGIELRFHAKTPGPRLALQTLDMRFDYKQAFDAARGTGYEIMLYSCMNGDATLFSRTDLVESAWRVAQPILDAWAAEKAGDAFPNYPAGSWGPKDAYELIERDGRTWVEIVNRDFFKAVPLFAETDSVFRHNLAMTLRSDVCEAGDMIVREGEMGSEMYFIARGQVEVLDKQGNCLTTLCEGEFFGELALLLSQPRKSSVRAKKACDLFVLEKADFDRVMRENPKVAEAVKRRAGMITSGATES